MRHSGSRVVQSTALNGGLHRAHDLSLVQVVDDEAVTLMNDSPYGLTASLWTRDRDAAETIGAQIETGTVFMNRCDYLDPALVWTGVKDTGNYYWWNLGGWNNTQGAVEKATNGAKELLLAKPNSVTTGTTYDLKVEDDATDPKQGIAVFEQFISRDPVSVILGPTLSNAAKTTDRSGFGPEANARASSITAAMPVALSTAPL